MESLADSHVEVDASKTTNPIAANVQAYNEAFVEYNKILSQVSPLYV